MTHVKDEGPRLLQKYYLQYCNKKKEASHGFTGAESHPGLMEVMQKNRDESDLIFYQSIGAFAVSHFLEHKIGRRGWGAGGVNHSCFPGMQSLFHVVFYYYFSSHLESQLSKLHLSRCFCPSGHS